MTADIVLRPCLQASKATIFHVKDPGTIRQTCQDQDAQSTASEVCAKVNEGRATQRLASTASCAEVSLIVCPFAGASSSAFRSWRAINDFDVDVSLAVYPGRDSRMHEPCAKSIDQIAKQLFHAIKALHMTHRHLLLVGHSMGAQVAFETCAYLEQDGLFPTGLVLSACHAPHLRARRQLSHLDDNAFLEQLIDIGGCSPELLTNPALLAIFLSLLRADFYATETYYRDLIPNRQRLHTPTLLLYGSDDKEACLEEVQAWQAWLCNASIPVAISGNHFYATHQPHEFLKQIMCCFFE